MQPQKQKQSEHVITGPHHVALVEINSAYSPPVTPDTPDVGGNCGKETRLNYGEGQAAQSALIWSWGKNNLLPNEREQLVMENNILGELISTKQTVSVGAGLLYYRLSYQDGKEVKELVEEPTWLRELRDRMDLEDYFDLASKNLFMHANIFTEFIRDKSGKIFSIECLEGRHTRAGIQNPLGYIEDYFWCGNWKERNKQEKFPIQHTPAYNMREDRPQPKFIYHVGDKLLTDDYYCIPSWWGGRKWIEAANKIPKFHNSNLDNGYFLRMQVEMPKDYFSDMMSMAQAKSEEERKTLAGREDQARQEFIKKVNSFLSGEGSTGRAIFTEYDLDKRLNKEFPGIKFNKIEINPLDEAMLKLFERSNEAVISGQGVHPALAAIQTQGKLSSGSEIRNANSMFIAVKTPKPRRLLLKALNLLKRINAPENERDILIGFRDIEVTNLDENKAGRQEETYTMPEA